MRIIIVLIFGILLSAALYTAYGVMTFEPQKPAPLVFKEPTPETLAQLGYYAKNEKVSPELTTSQQEQTSSAVAKIADAMKTYQDNAARATPRLANTLTIINGAIGSGKLPAYFLNVADAQNPDRRFETLNYDPTSVLEVKSPQTAVTCTAAPKVTSVLIGDDGANTLGCDTPGPGDQIFLGGPGNDTITDTAGNRIINAGSGNDTITAGPGRTILVLEDGWGQDTATVDCSGADIQANEIPANFPIPWVSKFTNFIVLSPRIEPSTVQWDGLVLKNTVTGDTLTVNENCFSVVSAQ